MGISTGIFECEDMTSCTDLTRRHAVDEIATFCHYTVVASIFLVSAASCKAICGELQTILSHFG